MLPQVPRARIFPRWMVAAAAIFIVGWLLYLLRGVLTPIFFAFLIAYMLDPVVDRFEARGYSRGVGIAVMLSVVLGGLGLLLAVAVPAIVRDLAGFVMDLPEKAKELVALLEPWLSEVGVVVPDSWDKALDEFHIDMGELAGKAALPAGEVLLWLLGRAGWLLGALAGLVMIPVFAAYLLYDFDRIITGIRDLVPGRYRGWVSEVARDVDGILGEFIRGQLIVMMILAVLYSTAYLLVGVKLAVLIGVVAGLLSFIPYVGGGVALVLAVVMSLVYWTGWGQLVGVVVSYTIIQVFEGFVITPRVVGDKVGLSAVWVLFALLVGGEVFGFMGVLLALPAASVIKIFVGRGLTWYRASALFLETEGHAAGDEASAEEAVADEAAEDEAVADEAVADEAVADEAVADDAAVDEAAVDQAVVDEVAADEVAADEADADQADADQADADQAAADQAVAARPRPEFKPPSGPAGG